MKISPLPFAGESQSLHSWQPAFINVAQVLAELADNLTVKSYDPTIAYGGSLAGTTVVNWARYRTLEPLAKLCYMDVNLTASFTGTADARIFMSLPIPPIRPDNPITLKGTVAEGGASITVSGRNSTDTALLLMQKESAANWTVSSSVTIWMAGWYDYGD